MRHRMVPGAFLALAALLGIACDEPPSLVTTAPVTDVQTEEPPAAPRSSCPYTEMLFVTECRGAAPSPAPQIPGQPAFEPPPPTRVPICQLCITDAHCSAQPYGRCITPRTSCGAARHICQYPGDACYPGSCSMNCLWRDVGEVECSARGPMVPA